MTPSPSMEKTMADTKHTPGPMRQFVKTHPRISGAHGSDLCECSSLAKLAWGDCAIKENSGLTAFAYLWRRFGPPVWGSDEHKRLVSYILTTSHQEVFLSVDLSASEMYLNVGYLCTKRLDMEFHKPQTDWWRAFRGWVRKQNPGASAVALSQLVGELSFDKGKRALAAKDIGKYPLPPRAQNWKRGSGVQKLVNETLVSAMRELLRPVFIRDVAINIFGRLTDDEARRISPAEPSIYSGFGIPMDAMERLRKKYA